MAAASVTSATNTRAVPPTSSHLAARSRSRSSLRARRPSVAPRLASARASASPIPLEAPVRRMIWLFQFMFSSVRLRIADRRAIDRKSAIRNPQSAIEQVLYLDDGRNDHRLCSDSLLYE